MYKTDNTIDSNMKENDVEVDVIDSNLEMNRTGKNLIENSTCHLVPQNETPTRKALIDRGIVSQNLKLFDKTEHTIDAINTDKEIEALRTIKRGKISVKSPILKSPKLKKLKGQK